jgi:hypothetical protein
LDEADRDGQTLLVRYPSALAADAYVRSEVRIECGAKSALDPHVSSTLRPYINHDLVDLDLTVADVVTIQPTRTFWDKVVIVHGLRGWFDSRGELRQEGQRISRHYWVEQKPVSEHWPICLLAPNACVTRKCSSTGRRSISTPPHRAVSL